MKNSKELLREADTPLVWFGAGALTVSWWLKHPSSRLFWFAAGVSAATWWINTPFSQYRAAFRANKHRHCHGPKPAEAPIPIDIAPPIPEPETPIVETETVETETSRLDALEQKASETTAALDKLAVIIEALRYDLAERKAEQSEHASSDGYVFH